MTLADDRRRTALHESAHAVADVVFGRRIEYASIRPGRTFAGIEVATRVGVPDADRLAVGVVRQPPGLRADVERRVIVLLAGEIAALALADEAARSGYASDEAEGIARDALARLGPRVAELVVEHEEREESTGSDEENAWTLVNAFTGSEAGPLYLAWLRVETWELVARYRDAILRVADALECIGVLAGPEIAALVFPQRAASSAAGDTPEGLA